MSENSEQKITIKITSVEKGEPTPDHVYEADGLRPDDSALLCPPFPASDHEKVAEDIADYLSLEVFLNPEIKTNSGYPLDKLISNLNRILSRNYPACRCEEYRELLIRAYPFVRKFGYSFIAEEILAAIEVGKEGGK